MLTIPRAFRREEAILDGLDASTTVLLLLYWERIGKSIRSVLTALEDASTAHSLYLCNTAPNV